MYDLPDTVKLGLTEAQAYAVAWDTFHRIQKKHLMRWFIILVATMSAWIVALILHLQPVDFIKISLPLSGWILFRLLASFCGVFGFFIMFNSPISLAVSAAFIGAIANTLRLELVDLVNVPPAAAAFIGALTAGILALPLGLIFARILTDKTFRYCT